ncbi:MAG: hypothetical protein AAB847_01805, partial [Patescibacteria group bacterium]
MLTCTSLDLATASPRRLSRAAQSRQQKTRTKCGSYPWLLLKRSIIIGPDPRSINGMPFLN